MDDISDEDDDKGDSRDMLMESLWCFCSNLCGGVATSSSLAPVSSLEAVCSIESPEASSGIVAKGVASTSSPISTGASSSIGEVFGEFMFVLDRDNDLAVGWVDEDATYYEGEEVY